MRLLKHRFVHAALALGLLLTSVTPALAQARPNRGRAVPGPGALADGGVSPGELQQLFDAYVVMQAQTELELTDEQYPQFLTRVRALQDLRRRTQVERNRLLQNLRRLTQNPSVDDNDVRTELKALADLDLRSEGQLRQSTEAVDQVLTLRQQARFRLFEEQMERRKVDLLMRARQANRQRQ